MLGEFEAGSAGRNGLPSAQWWELVKLQALAMKQVAGELALASVWSWGWGTFGSTDVDPDKPMTACVWLWARDPSLCDAPGVAGAALDTSLDEGQLTQIPIGAQCVWPGGKLEVGEVRALAATPSHPGVAEQLLLDQLLLQQQLAAQQLPDPAVAAAAVARSERAVVDDRFAGSQFRFLAALNRVGFSEADARLLLANQLRIRALERSVLAATVPAASLAGARTLLGSQPNRPVRLVRLLPLAGAPVPWWLGGTSGYALSGLAPARLFRLPAGQTVTLYTPDGDYQATAIAAARPVSELNAGQRARLALLLREALTRQARARAVAAWLARQEQQLFPAMLCVRDVLPAADGGKRLLRRATFLAISA